MYTADENEIARWLLILAPPVAEDNFQVEMMGVRVGLPPKGQEAWIC